MTLLQVQQAIGESPAVAEVYRTLENAGVHPMQIGDWMLEIHGQAEIDKLKQKIAIDKEKLDESQAELAEAERELSRLKSGKESKSIYVDTIARKKSAASN